MFQDIVNFLIKSIEERHKKQDYILLKFLNENSHGVTSKNLAYTIKLLNIGQIYTTISRLTEQGYLIYYLSSNISNRRGFKPSYIYQISESGKAYLEEIDKNLTQSANEIIYG